ncbi:MAG: tetratricopeptide repeat protein [Pirellulaceae bacterium]
MQGYKLIREIARGGMGIVFLAEQFEPVHRQVALKIIKPGVDTKEVIARFNIERQALSMMNHPNIARALDAGSTETGQPFFVMELVHGKPITTYCEEKRLSLTERLELFTTVCFAIQHAHQKGIIHRDIKPSNVMVTEYDGQPVAKVIDFGVAKAISQTVSSVTVATGFGQIIGTFDYMSPEQSRVNQQDVDTRSDIYSLGVLLYEMLTETPPFDRDRLRSADLDEVFHIIREEDPPRPSVRIADCRKGRWAEQPTQLGSATTRKSAGDVRLQATIEQPSDRRPDKLSRRIKGELDWIVMKAMEKERSRRYATPNGIADDITRFLSGEEVSACPPSPLYRIRKFASRNKTVLATSALVSAAILVAVLGIAYQSVLSSKAIAKANAEKFEFIIETVLGTNTGGELTDYSPDPNLKLMILLRNASDRVDEAFADDPERGASMKSTLASLLANVGQYDDAARLYNDYYQYVKRTQGPNARETIGVMRNLVRIYIEESNYGEALDLSERGLLLAKEHLGAEDELTLQFLSDRGDLDFRIGNLEMAVKEYLAVLETQMRRHGPQDPLTLATKTRLGIVYEELRRFKDSKTLFEDALASYEKSLTSHDPRLAAAKQRLGNWYLNAGRRRESRDDFLEAEELLTPSLEIYYRNRGKDHMDSLDTSFALAQTLVELQEIDRARALLEDLTSRLELLRHPSDLMLQRSRNMLGWIYLQTSDLLEAEYLLTNTMDRIDHSEEQKLLAIQVRSNLAIARYRMGKIKEAVLLDETTLQMAGDRLGDSHHETLATQTRLGLGHLELQNDHLAIPLLVASVDAFQGQPESKEIEAILREHSQHQSASTEPIESLTPP